MSQVKKGSDGVYDFDAIAADKPRYARVGGETADISVIPVAVQMLMGALSKRTSEEILRAAEEDPMGEYRQMIDQVAAVCLQSNPKMTADFLMEHLDEVRLTAFFKFVFDPAQRAAEAVEGEAGAASPE